MSRIGVLLPHKHRDNTFAQKRMTMERHQYDYDESSVNLFGRKVKTPVEIMTPQIEWDLYRLRHQMPPKDEIEFKQPEPIRVNPFQVRQESVAIPVADDTLTRRFLLDRRATRGMINSKQLDRLEVAKALRKKRSQKLAQNLDFNPQATVINAKNVSREVEGLMNARF